MVSMLKDSMTARAPGDVIHQRRTEPERELLVPTGKRSVPRRSAE